jgi:hypothetical protein
MPPKLIRIGEAAAISRLGIGSAGERLLVARRDAQKGFDPSIHSASGSGSSCASRMTSQRAQCGETQAAERVSASLFGQAQP